jgi:pteridine reductase
MEAKVVLITGAGKRVGACIARTLHEQGMRVIIHYCHSRDPAVKLADELNKARKDSAATLQADLTDMADIETMAKAAGKTWGRVDALVNNASSFYPSELGSVDNEHWDALMTVNAKAPYFLAQALLPLLQQAKGSIVNLVDIHADRPLKNHSVYCMAKAAMVAMTKALAGDLAPDVRVNGIAPGMMLWPDDGMNEKTKKYIINRIPLQRTGTPADVAETVAFLLKQAYITGQIIAVDGGRTLTI